MKYLNDNLSSFFRRMLGDYVDYRVRHSNAKTAFREHFTPLGKWVLGIPTGIVLAYLWLRMRMIELELKFIQAGDHQARNQSLLHKKVAKDFFSYTEIMELLDLLGIGVFGSIEEKLKLEGKAALPAIIKRNKEAFLRKHGMELPIQIRVDVDNEDEDEVYQAVWEQGTLRNLLKEMQEYKLLEDELADFTRSKMSLKERMAWEEFRDKLQAGEFS